MFCFQARSPRFFFFFFFFFKSVFRNKPDTFPYFSIVSNDFFLNDIISRSGHHQQIVIFIFYIFDFCSTSFIHIPLLERASTRVVVVVVVVVAQPHMYA